ncbi:reprolysin-like metallopeptidase [Kordiimonas lipolytica]|uniref:Reprolysin-like metallopeptidase n=1 Tax=Kordiimonas lipolytica TaxID=1662421 RepID=A0ABV8U703_9PROT|nr:M10 family metallopeptidase [Kordiimonas lipolytica]
MADITNDLTTTASVAEGEEFEGAIESVGDEDWIAVTLTAGVTYGFSLRGLLSNNGTLEDPYIKGIYDSNGNSLGVEDDDSGDGRESLLVFTPDTSGTYYISAGSWDGPFDGYDPTGTYTFSYGEYAGTAVTPFSEAFAEQTEASGITEVDALLSLWRYKNLEGTEATEVTYSYPTDGSIYSEDPDFGYGSESADSEPWAGISYLIEAEKDLFDDALSQISSFANIVFTLVPDNAESAGVIRPAWTNLADEDAAAWAYLPYSSSQAGDIWFLSQNQSTGGEGSYFHTVLLHELGHAVGLKHTFDSDGSGVVMPAEYDGLEYTVMSYNSSVDTDIHSLDFYPTTYMYYDILALQHLYGAIDANEGDTTYSFLAGTRYYETVWDTGGTDTYDASSQTKAVHLDLTPGSWSNVGTTVLTFGGSSASKTDTVFTPPEITIERALGGLGDDTLTGNDAANLLAGNAGDDSITGGGGDDTLRGNAGEDTLKGGLGNDALWAGAGDASADRMSGGLGNDTLGGGAGNDLLDGGNGADVVFGGSGDDTIAGGGWVNGAAVTDETSAAQLWAGDGNDFVFGADGNDQLGGGDDDDNISGFGGDDVIYAGKTGADTLDGGDGDDVIFGGSENDVVSGGGGNDEIYGGGGNDVVTGGTGVDTLYGGTGDDTLTGGGGDDILRGGDGADVFVFSGSGGDDQIDGFTIGEDILDLGDTTTDFTNLASVQAAASETADGLLIDLGGGDSLLLTGLSVADLSGIDILYS